MRLFCGIRVQAESGEEIQEESGRTLKMVLLKKGLYRLLRHEQSQKGFLA